GSWVAFAVSLNPKTPVYTVPVHGGMPKKVCEDCARLDDWSSDGKKMLYHWSEPRRVAVLDLESRRQQDILVHPIYNLYQPHFSSDDRWITFHAQIDPEHRRLYIVPANLDRLQEEKNWIAITTGEYSDDKPRFSPSGNLLYFTSNRDGF